MDWAARVAWLELSWARHRDEENPSKRTTANEGVFRIVNDSTCFTIEIPLGETFTLPERKTAVFLRTQRRESSDQI
jgi:hypothetical protein